MKKVWALGVVQLKPGLLRFFCWSKDFDPHNQTQSHAQLWARLLNLPQEYWRKATLFEIASGIGTPLTIDEATQSRLFGYYARILVDVDMSGKLFDYVVVKREDYAFPVTIEYERRPSFCSHCKMLGYSIQHCNHINNAQSYAAPRNHQKKPFQQAEPSKKTDSLNITQQPIYSKLESLQSNIHKHDVCAPTQVLAYNFKGYLKCSQTKADLMKSREMICFSI